MRKIVMAVESRCQIHYCGKRATGMVNGRYHCAEHANLARGMPRKTSKWGMF